MNSTDAVNASVPAWLNVTRARETVVPPQIPAPFCPVFSMCLFLDWVACFEAYSLASVDTLGVWHGQCRLLGECCVCTHLQPHIKQTKRIPPHPSCVARPRTSVRPAPSPQTQPHTKGPVTNSEQGRARQSVAQQVWEILRRTWSLSSRWLS